MVRCVNENVMLGIARGHGGHQVTLDNEKAPSHPEMAGGLKESYFVQHPKQEQSG